MREILIKQFELYPEMQIQDVFKVIYQSVFGCGHFVYDEAKCRELLQREMRKVKNYEPSIAVESLGRYSRVHLAAAQNLKISESTLLRLFMISAKEEKRTDEYIGALNLLPEFCENGMLPFAENEMRTAVNKHIAEGCPPLHHSEAFQKKYHPAYRVIKTEYLSLLTLIEKTDRLLKSKKNPLIAIDGCCASGKTELAAFLQHYYDADVIHMDDYFLPFDKKTEKRLSKPGGNIDHERFLSELLLPLSKGEKYIYRPYRCHVGCYEEPREVAPSGLTFIEGSYSLHPDLEKYYDLKVFLSIAFEEQTERLRMRDPEMLTRFISEWIPLENEYFEKTEIEKRCDIHMSAQKKFCFEVLKC